MILSTIGALWIIIQARRGQLTAVRYAQGLKPGDPGYGEPVLDMHLYTWALITFYVVILFVAVVSMLAPVGIPEPPTEAGAQRTISTIIVGLFVLVVAANVVAIIFLEGFAWVLPDDSTGYNLLDQFGL